ncbi:helix-turn-helix domain-containing protein [Scytonema sp. UIC 10036]|uniref:helix-turn-helix domain-containing protein n=1 Tax=Scytonema sp. UIC 10036 TaxID=2304196 RepID=UPI00140FAA74|nr:helix-turn-helix domain-containing protein [Scytonema sp. UIC 10036]
MLLQTNKKQPIVPTESKSPLLTLSQAQALCGLSVQTLHDAIFEGRLRARMIGKDWKIRSSDLKEYLSTSNKNR